MTGAGPKKVTHEEAETLNHISSRVEEGVEARRRQENLDKWQKVETIESKRVYLDPDLRRFIELGVDDLARQLSAPKTAAAGIPTAPRTGETLESAENKSVIKGVDVSSFTAAVRSMVEQGHDSTKVVLAIRDLINKRSSNKEVDNGKNI
jgi:hypothetical protein